MHRGFVAALVNAATGVNDIVQIYFISPAAPDKTACLAALSFGPGPGRNAVKTSAPHAGCRSEDAMSRLLERRIDHPISDRWDRGFVPAC
jgi:hypothetical protein